MSEFTGEKTHEPTPHRRQQARREGRVVRSHELGSAATWMLGLGALALFGGGLVGYLVDYCRGQLGGEAWVAADAGFLIGRCNAALAGLAGRMLPLLGVLCLAAVAVGAAQGGLRFHSRPLLDLARLNPARGLQRMFSADGAARLTLGISKLSAVAVLAGILLYQQREALGELTALGPRAICDRLAGIFLGMSLKLGGTLLALGALDYAYQRWRHERELRMTPQELREELRNLEGDRQVVGRRKGLARELSRRRAAEAAPIRPVE
jgi:flagellar biosynthetic protein FlhB